MLRCSIEHIALFFVCILYSISISHTQNLSSIVSCPTFVDIPIYGSPGALEILRGWCVADNRCAELYGQSITAKENLFNTLFQTTTHSFTGTLYLQSPLIEKVCANNMTWEDVNILLWQLILRVDILERGRSCYEGETPLVNATGQISCEDLPWAEEAAVSGFNALGLAIEIAIVIVLSIAIVTQIWSFARRRNFQQL